VSAPDISTINAWADDLRGPVALHLRQTLIPIEGDGGVIFPPTYAMGENRKGGPYAIDELSDGKKVVQVDSVGSQANRMEPLFQRARPGTAPNPLSDLVPQIDIVMPDLSIVSLLEVGHRLGDALVRSSSLREDAIAAFKAYSERGDATDIAKLAPTSLVFGAWDSRGEGAKLSRIVQSVIRAWDVEPLRRSAQYNPPVDYAKFDVFNEDEKAKAEGNTKNPLAQRGFVHVPAVDTHGGVVARGPIYRDVTINLVALRQLGAPQNDRELRRYVLGLALVAATEPQDGFLRQGCLLTPAPDVAATWTVVARNGKRDPAGIDSDTALSYAKSAATAFGVGKDKQIDFLSANAKSDAKEGKGKKA
jgi:CRISPR-associated protein Csb1